MFKNLIKNHSKVKVVSIIVGVIVALSLVITPFCIKRIKVDAGEEVVLVKKPIFTIFGHGGTVKETVKTGSIWVARTTEGYGIPVTPIQYEEKFDDMSTKNATPYKTNKLTKIEVYFKDKRKYDHIKKYCDNIWIFWEKDNILEKYN